MAIFRPSSQREDPPARHSLRIAEKPIARALPRWGRRLAFGAVIVWMIYPKAAMAQLDPEKRRVLQFGYAGSVHENGPIAAYGFYYHNQPNFPRTNLTLRLAVAPVYLDSELGIRGALGPNTDLGIGLAGGGFADSYSEIRHGDYLRSESFTGHTAEGLFSIYHLFNPEDRAPLHGIIRGGLHRSIYERDNKTADDFVLPEDRTTFHLRSGLRLGGREPYLTPSLAAELSIWHEGQFRFEEQDFGFDEDRRVESQSHLFWARALLAYTFEKSQRYMEFSITAGTSLDADRFSTYRLGGSLPLIAEFPLTLPGYHRHEISAEKFVQFSGNVMIPLDPGKRLSLGLFGAMAAVDYLDGLEQPGNFHSGVGGGLLYRNPSRAWQLGIAYSYGVDAIRDHGRGAHSVTFLMQYDLDAALRSQDPFWNPLFSADTWQGFLGIFTGGR